MRVIDLTFPLDERVREPVVEWVPGVNLAPTATYQGLGRSVHQVVMGTHGVLIEMLANLGQVDQRRFTFLVLPLKSKEVMGLRRGRSRFCHDTDHGEGGDAKS